MTGGPIRIWNEWAIQILVLLSFALQIFLFLFARTRRNGPSTVLRILLWLAYLMADSTTVYTLGHLSINDSPREQKLTVFWAPFLLVHLGSQDTITAYALEDNQLWPRHLLNLGVQAFGVAYVLYKHIAEIPTSMGLATGLMFFIGLIKYGERIWALKCATLDSILSSIREPQAVPIYYHHFQKRGRRVEEQDEEELLLFAQGMLPVCKGAMADFPMELFESSYNSMMANFTYRWKWNWKATLNVVEKELSLMYDILYTKIAVIHNLFGYCIRVFFLLATITVFVLFQLSGNKDGYNRVDVAITYILLVGAFFLDMVSVLSALGSTWTCHFLLERGWTKLGLVLLSLRRHVKADRGNRRWSGSIGQFNLLHFCSRDTTKLSSKVAKMMGLKDWWNKRHYPETLVISEDVKELVFKHVWQTVKVICDPRVVHEIQSPPNEKGVEKPITMPLDNNRPQFFAPESYKRTEEKRMKLDKALCSGAEFQEMILTFHIFTDVFLLSSSGTLKDKGASSSTYLKAIKMLSDYIVFLLARRPNTIAGLELRGLYEATCDDLQHKWKWRTHDDKTSFATREEELASTVLYDHHAQSTVILKHGALYAKYLRKLVNINDNAHISINHRPYEDSNQTAKDMLKLLLPDLELVCREDALDMHKAVELIFNTWVRLLIIVSIRCRRDAHARQINSGGELTTVVWLMVEHILMFFRPRINW